MLALGSCQHLFLTTFPSGLFFSVCSRHREHCFVASMCSWKCSLAYITEHWRALLLTLAVLCVQANSKQEVMVRRNSFTPMSSQDQVKRPRVFSVGNPPCTPLPPSLSSTDVFEAQENEELAEKQVWFLTLYAYTYTCIHERMTSTHTRACKDADYIVTFVFLLYFLPAFYCYLSLITLLCTSSC